MKGEKLMYRNIIVLVISIMIAYTNLRVVHAQVYSAQILGGVPCDEDEAEDYDQCIIEFRR